MKSQTQIWNANLEHKPGTQIWNVKSGTQIWNTESKAFMTQALEPNIVIEQGPVEQGSVSTVKLMVRQGQCSALKSQCTDVLTGLMKF